MTLPIDDYRWPQNYAASEGGVDRGAPCTAESATVAVASDSEGDVLAALRIDPASRFEATFHEAEATWTEDLHPVQVWRHGDRTIVVEPNGWHTSLPAGLLAVAGKGLAASAYWSVNADMRVTVARDGEVIRAFDPLCDPEGEGAPLPEEADLPFGDDDAPLIPSALLLVERLTGFRPSAAAILEGKKPTYRRPA